MDGPYVWRFKIWELLSKCSILEPSLAWLTVFEDFVHYPWFLWFFPRLLFHPPRLLDRSLRRASTSLGLATWKGFFFSLFSMFWLAPVKKSLFYIILDYINSDRSLKFYFELHWNWCIKGQPIWTCFESILLFTKVKEMLIQFVQPYSKSYWNMKA